MNKKSIYIVVAVLVVVLVIAVAAYVFLYKPGESTTNPTPTPTPVPVADATSLQFTVEDSTGTYNYYARNIGSATDLAIEYVDEAAGFSIIFNGTAHTSWSDMTGTWVEGDFEADWAQWNPLFEGYVDSLVHWTEGDWTSDDGTTTISDIAVNPTLDEACFEVPST